MFSIRPSTDMKLTVNTGRVVICVICCVKSTFLGSQYNDQLLFLYENIFPCLFQIETMKSLIGFPTSMYNDTFLLEKYKQVTN